MMGELRHHVVGKLPVIILNPVYHFYFNIKKVNTEKACVRWPQRIIRQATRHCSKRR